MKKIMISHGTITHSAQTRLDCMDCIKVELEYLKAVKKAGGQTNLIKSLARKLRSK